MKKPLQCLFSVLLFLSLFTLPNVATAEDDDLSGCCKAPVDLIYWCSDLPRGFNPRHTYQLQSLFGAAQNKCYPGCWEELPPTVKLTNCETGTIVRNFRVWNPHHPYHYEYCYQTITIKGVHNYEIRFPADAQAGCGETPVAENIVTNESECDLLAISVSDQNFSTVRPGGGGCGKILRTYKVINWCEYNGISDKVVISRDEDCDGVAGDEAVWVLRRSDGYAFIDRDNYEQNFNPKAGERKTCTPTNPNGYWRTVHSTGYWEYTQYIKIGDGDAPILAVTQPNPICSYTNDCLGYVQIPFSVSDKCTPEDVRTKVFIDGKFTTEYRKSGNYEVVGKYELGNHKFEIHATDACNNTIVAKVDFQIVDCAAPYPICINGVGLSLMPNEPNNDADGDGDVDEAFMDIWVTDLFLNANKLSDCSGVAGYSINRVGERPDLNKKSLTLTCDDVGNTVFVQIYAWDNAYNPYALQPDSTRGGRNFSFCRTYILVRDNQRRCSPSGNLVRNNTTKAADLPKTNIKAEENTAVYFDVNGSHSLQLDFKLYQNVPNPFTDKTLIQFHLPEATTATLKVYDVTGKLLWQQNGQFDKGQQQITVEKSALAAQGLLFYTLETPTHRAVGKMVVL